MWTGEIRFLTPEEGGRQRPLEEGRYSTTAARALPEGILPPAGSSGFGTMFSIVFCVGPEGSEWRKVRVSALVPGAPGSQILVRGAKLVILAGARPVGTIKLDLCQRPDDCLPDQQTELGAPYVGAYWGPRGQTTHECAVRVAACIQELDQLDLTKADQWRYPRHSADEDKPQRPGVAVLEAVLREGAYRERESGHTAPGLGFAFELYNAGEGDVAVTGAVGSAFATPAAPNRVVVSLLELDGTAGDPDRFLEVGERLLGRMVEMFEPDWAVFSRCGWWTPQTAPAVGEPPPGFATYVRGRGGRRFHAPAGRPDHESRS